MILGILLPNKRLCLNLDQNLILDTINVGFQFTSFRRDNGLIILKIDYTYSPAIISSPIIFCILRIHEICEFLLSSISKEELMKISIESDVYYLRETAKKMLQN